MLRIALLSLFWSTAVLEGREARADPARYEATVQDASEFIEFASHYSSIAGELIDCHDAWRNYRQYVWSLDLDQNFDEQRAAPEMTERANEAMVLIADADHAIALTLRDYSRFRVLNTGLGDSLVRDRISSYDNQLQVYQNQIYLAQQQRNGSSAVYDPEGEIRCQNILSTARELVARPVVQRVLERWSDQ